LFIMPIKEWLVFVAHGFHRLAYFLSDQKVGKKSPGTHGFPNSPSYLLASVLGVGVFDWTDAAVRGSVFWVVLCADGCFSS
jgi:hypothetical protein